jgi:hypothetical protein
MVKKALLILLKAVLAWVLYGLAYVALMLIGLYTYGFGVYLVLLLAAVFVVSRLTRLCSAARARCL